MPRGLLTRNLVEMAEPFHLAAIFREGVAEPQPLRQIGEDVEIVARLVHRRDGLMHREHVAVGGRGDVVALQCRRRRQHDVGVARGRRPPDLVDDDRLGTLPCPDQTVDVLMMVKRIPAAPIDELDVGKGDPLAIVVDGGAGVEQQIGNPRHRNDTIGSGSCRTAD